MAREMVSTNRSGGTAKVGYLTSFRSLPFGVTTAAAILVPPTSTPMAFITYLLVLEMPSASRTLQAARGEGFEGDIVEAGDDEVGVGVGQQLLVFSPREAQRGHVAGLGRLHTVGRVLDHEGLFGQDTRFP